MGNTETTLHPACLIECKTYLNLHVHITCSVHIHLAHTLCLLTVTTSLQQPPARRRLLAKNVITLNTTDLCGYHKLVTIYVTCGLIRLPVP